LAFQKTLLIQADMLDVFKIPSDEPPFNSSIHDPLHAHPAQPQMDSGLLDAAGCLQETDGEGFEHQGEASVRLGPGDFNGLHSAVGTLRARNSSGENGLELHRVQMSPGPLRRMILERSLGRTLRTANRCSRDMLNLNPDALLLQRQIDIHHPPGPVQPQQQPVMLRKRVHEEQHRHSSPDWRPSHYLPPTKFREEPTLTGTVPSYAQKLEAERVVKRVIGVMAVANDIEVTLLGHLHPNDTEIAEAALNSLRWNSSLPQGQIKVTVRQGHLTLEGNVDWHYQRETAADAVRYLTGVRGVNNLVNVIPQVKLSEVSNKIKAAFKRNAEIDARHVKVAAQGGKVILDGKVASLTERSAAEHAAWSAPGVASVENHLTVGV